MLDALDKLITTARSNIVGALVVVSMLAVMALLVRSVHDLQSQFSHRYPDAFVEQGILERSAIARVAVQAELSAVLAVTSADRAVILRLTNHVIDLSGLPMLSVTLEAAAVAPGVGISDRFFGTLPAGLYAELFAPMLRGECQFRDLMQITEPALRFRLAERGVEKALFCPLIHEGRAIGLVSLEWLDRSRASDTAIAPLIAASSRISGHLARTALR